MSQHRNDQKSDSVERANQLKRDVNSVIDILLAEQEATLRERDDLQENEKKLQSELDDLKTQLEEKKYSLSRAEEDRRGWQRRYETQTNVQDSFKRELIAKLGRTGIFGYLDRFINDENTEVTPKTIQGELFKWILEVYKAKPEPIFPRDREEFGVEEMTNLVEWEGEQPWSDTVRRARCKVIKTGWKIGSDPVEKALLKFLEPITEDIEDDNNEDQPVADAVDHEPDEFEVKESSSPESDVDVIFPLNEEQINEFLSSLPEEVDENLKSAQKKRLEVVLSAIMRCETLEQAVQEVNAKTPGNNCTENSLRKNMRTWEKGGPYQEVVKAIDNEALRSFFEQRWQNLMQKSE